MRELAEAAAAIVAGSSAPTPASKASIERPATYERTNPKIDHAARTCRGA
jgi:hypothetical protein